MPTRFRPYQPKQMLLLSPDLREWVPEGHLAHQVSTSFPRVDPERSLLPRRQVGPVAAALPRGPAVIDHPVGQEGVGA